MLSRHLARCTVQGAPRLFLLPSGATSHRRSPSPHLLFAEPVPMSHIVEPISRRGFEPPVRYPSKPMRPVCHQSRKGIVFSPFRFFRSCSRPGEGIAAPLLLLRSTVRKPSGSGSAETRGQKPLQPPDSRPHPSPPRFVSSWRSIARPPPSASQVAWSPAADRRPIVPALAEAQPQDRQQVP